MLDAYREHIDARAADGVPPQPLNAQQTSDLIELLKQPPAGEESFLLLRKYWTGLFSYPIYCVE